VFTRCGWVRGPDGQKLEVDRSQVVSLLTALGADNILDAMDRVAICEEALLEKWQEDAKEVASRAKD